jgi:hypothetical protein
MSDTNGGGASIVDPKCECLYLMVGDRNLKLTPGGQARWSEIWDVTVGAYLSKHASAWKNSEFHKFVRELCAAIADLARDALKPIYTNVQPEVSAPVLDYATVTVMIARFHDCKHVVRRMLAQSRGNAMEAEGGQAARSADDDLRMLLAVCAEYLTEQSITLPVV